MQVTRSLLWSVQVVLDNCSGSNSEIASVTYIKINQKVHDIVLAPGPGIVTIRILVFVALRAHKCCGLKCDMAMLKAALTSCNLTRSHAPASHKAVTNVVMLTKQVPIIIIYLLAGWLNLNNSLRGRTLGTH